MICLGPEVQWIRFVNKMCRGIDRNILASRFYLGRVIGILSRHVLCTKDTTQGLKKSLNAISLLSSLLIHLSPYMNIFIHFFLPSDFILFSVIYDRMWNVILLPACVWDHSWSSLGAGGLLRVQVNQCLGFRAQLQLSCRTVTLYGVHVMWGVAVTVLRFLCLCLGWSTLSNRPHV